MLPEVDTLNSEPSEDVTAPKLPKLSSVISDVTSAGLIRVASKERIKEAGKLPFNKLAKMVDVRYIANGELWRIENIFQLSVELYDTTKSQVVWSDRWQENWDNLHVIKNNLSDGFLKALNIKLKLEKRIDSDNTQAYEFYLKGKFFDIIFYLFPFFSRSF